MAKLTKPDISVRWAELGDNTKPLDSYIQNGWEAVKPPRQYFNWLDNRQDSLLAYINQAGIPEWDAITEYEGGFSYVQGSDNKVYKCLADNTNTDPTDQPANAAFWEVAFAGKGDFDAVEARVDTLETEMGDGSGITNAAAWRTALSVYSQAEVDAILDGGMTVKKVVKFAGRTSDGTCTVNVNLGGTARVERVGSGYYRVLWSSSGSGDDMASAVYSILAFAQEGSAPTTVGAWNAPISSTVANIAVAGATAQDSTGAIIKCEGIASGGVRDPDFITVIVIGEEA